MQAKFSETEILCHFHLFAALRQDDENKEHAQLAPCIQSVNGEQLDAEELARHNQTIERERASARAHE